jgi:hypothetical protein
MRWVGVGVKKLTNCFRTVLVAFLLPKGLLFFIQYYFPPFFDVLLLFFYLKWVNESLTHTHSLTPWSSIFSKARAVGIRLLTARPGCTKWHWDRVFFFLPQYLQTNAPFWFVASSLCIKSQYIEWWWTVINTGPPDNEPTCFLLILPTMYLFSII